jgi:hypothetical protein
MTSSGQTAPTRLDATATPAFALLAGLASRGERMTYADFAFALGLPSPRNLGWLLGPLLGWCRAGDLPPLPIVVVRRADGRPSGGYEPGEVAAETARVFAFDWSTVAPPTAAELAAFGRDGALRDAPGAPRPLRSAACP